MKLLNGILYLEYSEYVPSVASEEVYKKQRDRKSINRLSRGGNGNPVLIEYESLPTKYKLKFKQHHCYKSCTHCVSGNTAACEWDPYDSAVKGPIKSRLVSDAAAHNFFLNFRFDTGASLSPEHVSSYTRAAEWLQMLNAFDCKADLIKQSFGLSAGHFWKVVCDIIEKEKIALPTSYKRLRMKIESYRAAGYSSLISGKFGNQNTAKICDETSRALLMEMIAHPHQFDDIAVAREYNVWAGKNGYQTIDPATVGYHRRKNESSLVYMREGESEFNKRYNFNIPGKRPSQPLFQISSDDNNLDIYFIDLDSTGGGKYFKKVVLITVMDAYNDYVLGYSWRVAESPLIEMVYAAYLDAAYQVKQLTGDFHMWHEIKADRWAIKTLGDFYRRQALYINTLSRNPKNKYIEQAFGEQWHDVLKTEHGYSGHNIANKNRGINPDFILDNKKNYSTLEEAGLKIERIITKLRNLPGKRDKTITREQEWMRGFEAMPAEHKRKVNDVFLLECFGHRHTHQVTISNNGVRATIEGVKYQYILPKEWHQQLIGKKLTVLYDRINMDRVLLIDGESTRVLAHNLEAIPRAAKDFGEGDRKRFNELLDIKRYNVRRITDAQVIRRKTLQEAGIDVEAVLQIGSGSVLKEKAKLAEYKYEMKQLGVDKSSPADDEDFDPYELIK